MGCMAEVVESQARQSDAFADLLRPPQKGACRRGTARRQVDPVEVLLIPVHLEGFQESVS
jgi:hypothetical protein